jgi:hypothetical protein
MTWTKSISFSSVMTMGHPSSPSLNETFKGFRFIHTNGCASYYLPSVGRMGNSPQRSKVPLSRMTQAPATFAQPITIRPMVWASSLLPCCPSHVFTENQALNFVDHSVLDVTTTRTTETPPIPYKDRFRRHIVRRDCKCVVTRGNPDLCDAAYIIPRKKGDAVRSMPQNFMW